MSDLKSYTDYQEETTQVRLFKSDKPRFDDLRRRLTMATGGESFSQAQVMRFLLDMVDGMEKFIRQEPPDKGE